jgi:hypothetical protein
VAAPGFSDRVFIAEKKFSEQYENKNTSYIYASLGWIFTGKLVSYTQLGCMFTSYKLANS